MAHKPMGKILWWGRGDKSYSRNRIVLGLMAELGFEVFFFHPCISGLGKLEALLRRPEKPDFLWVPCFRHRDVSSASYFAKKWNIPMIFDPLISAYQKEVFERQKWPVTSAKAKRCKKWETQIFSLPDIVVCDTLAHSGYFKEHLLVPEERLHLLFVGAEKDVFSSKQKYKTHTSFNALFYGSFLELQGVEVIVGAAKLSQKLPINWNFIGEGPCLETAKKAARGLNNVIFEPWMSYKKLSKKITDADILLGVFGDTLKADMVIPNKAYQAMAAGKPLITRRARAYDGNIADNPVIGWVSKGDSHALYNKICNWIDQPEMLSDRGRKTRDLFDEYFDWAKLLLMLKDIINAVNRKK